MIEFRSVSLRCPTCGQQYFDQYEIDPTSSLEKPSKAQCQSMQDAYGRIEQRIRTCNHD